ncbi:unnamed protein product [Caenorhabditis sp. 36 PRJEB53466]|nr:unnamed protein product [Caenorhabditis sp. 36 PRJEB53466]
MGSKVSRSENRAHDAGDASKEAPPFASESAISICVVDNRAVSIDEKKKEKEDDVALKEARADREMIRRGLLPATGMPFIWSTDLPDSDEENEMTTVSSEYEVVEVECIVSATSSDSDDGEERSTCGSDVEEPMKHAEELDHKMEALARQGMDWLAPRIEDIMKVTDPEVAAVLRETAPKPHEFFALEFGEIDDGLEITTARNEGMEELMNQMKKSSDLEATEDWETEKLRIQKVVEESKHDLDTPYIPTMDDFERDKNTHGQQQLGLYQILRRFQLRDGTVRLVCRGPPPHRTEDFWTEAHCQEVSLVVMWGKFEERPPGADRTFRNCARYIPADDQDEFACGDVIIVRMTETEQANEHCRIQRIAMRHKDIDRGWYTVWHCERRMRWDQAADYSRENAEFEELKLKLLSEMHSNVYLEHTEMEQSALKNPALQKWGSIPAKFAPPNRNA